MVDDSAADDDDDDVVDSEASGNEADGDASLGDNDTPLSPPTGMDKRFEMANPDRPYNMWPSEYW